MEPFAPENDLERALVASADSPNKRPDFLRLLLDSEVFAIVDGRGPEVTGRVRVEAGEKLKLRGMEVNGEDTVFLFTSLARLLHTAGGPAPFISGPGRAFFGLMGRTGLHLNPGAQYGVALPGDHVLDLAEGRFPSVPKVVTLQEGERFQIGPPPRAPSRVVEALASYLKTRAEVRIAYLAQMLDSGDGSPPHPIIGIETSAADEDFFREVSLVLQGVTPPGEIFDCFRLDNTSVSEAVRAHGKVVYRRKWFGLF
jgi:hypothetical protein